MYKINVLSSNRQVVTMSCECEYHLTPGVALLLDSSQHTPAHSPEGGREGGREGSNNHEK